MKVPSLSALVVRSGLLAAAALLAVGTALPGRALALETGGQGSTPLQLGNEAIGTLPSFWVDAGVWIPLQILGAKGMAAYSHVATTAYVPEELLGSFVAHADGYGFVFLDRDAPVGMVRARFYGDVRLVLQRDLVVSGQVSLGVTIGSHFADGQGMQMHGTAATSPFALPKAGKWVASSVGALAKSNALKSAPATLWVKSKWNAIGRVTALDHGGFLFLFQDMPF